MKVIGIDIGGTKTIIGIVDIKKGKVIKKISIPSKQFKNDKENLKSIVANTIDIIGKLNIKKVGIGVPELIDNKGIIKGDYNFNWLNKNLANNFPRKFKVIVDSDVRCHLRAEKLYGHGKNAKNFIYINIGTGLSYAHFKNNEIYSYDASKLELDPESRYIINVGSLGQPRDGNPDPVFVFYDSMSHVVEFHRFSYDLSSTQQKIRACGLPSYLADRLSDGR